MHALRRELSEGLCPLHETFVALIRLFGSKGRATRGLEILAAMEKLNFDVRQAWLVLIGTCFLFSFNVLLYSEKTCDFIHIRAYDSLLFFCFILLYF